MKLIALIALTTIILVLNVLNGSCTFQTPQAIPTQKEVQLTQKGGACGSGVGLNQGDTLVLVMDGDSASGYAWEVGFYVPAVIKPADKQERQSDSDRFSTSENQTFRFLAVGEGQAELLLIHKPFEVDLADTETCQVDVTVSGLGT
jgi:predicted secreted protein